MGDLLVQPVEVSTMKIYVTKDCNTNDLDGFWSF